VTWTGFEEKRFSCNCPGKKFQVCVLEDPPKPPSGEKRKSTHGGGGGILKNEEIMGLRIRDLIPKKWSVIFWKGRLKGASKRGGAEDKEELQKREEGRFGGRRGLHCPLLPNPGRKNRVGRNIIMETLKMGGTTNGKKREI